MATKTATKRRTKRRNTMTAEERHERAAELQNSITDQVDQLRDSDQWKNFLAFTRSFHSYSLNNLMLIMAQFPSASAVAGFRAWQAKGRQVRKGAKSIKIFGFAQKKIETEDEQGKPGEPQLKTYFPILSVFDISQTDLIDPDGEDHSTVAQRLKGDDYNGVIELVHNWLLDQGWDVNYSFTLGETNGYTSMDERQVVISADLSSAQQAKTILHEAAHVIMHSEEDYETYIEHRGLKETEAESVAYVVAGLLGLDSSQYSIGYVAQWSKGDVELIKETAGRVLKAVHVLASALLDEEDQDQV